MRLPTAIRWDETASFLCRAGTREEVAAKAKRAAHSGAVRRVHLGATVKRVHFMRSMFRIAKPNRKIKTPETTFVPKPRRRLLGTIAYCSTPVKASECATKTKAGPEVGYRIGEDQSV